MKRAYVEIRDTPHYRRDAFVEGLKACGFHVIERQLPPHAPGPEDVLVIWNRYSANETAADLWEKQGGTVLVAENGYCGRDSEGRQFYALAVHGHNGSGSWHVGGPERWESLGIELKPWRAAGEHILVCPNRHFGMKGLAMPYGWEQDTVKRLRQVTKRPIRVRPHPNGGAPARPLAADLENCHAVVIWASSAGVHSLIAGVPVVSLSPWWICRAAADKRLENIEAPALFDRAPVFEQLAWAQWSVQELASGKPFDTLLSAARERKVAAVA